MKKTTETLLLDQPDKFTEEGKVESVVVEDKNISKTSSNKKKNNKKLLTEQPVGSVEVIKE